MMPIGKLITTPLYFCCIFVKALNLYFRTVFSFFSLFIFLFFIYRSLLRDCHEQSQANFSRTCPSAWIGVGVGVNMSKNFDSQPTLLPQTPTPRRSDSAYQNPELRWHVPIIYVPDCNNCSKIPSAKGA